MDHKDKFRVKSDIAMFKILQEYGKLSERELAQKAGVSKNTARACLKRLLERDFFELRAVPKLERFSNHPMAILGFSELDNGKIDELEKHLNEKDHTIAFLHSGNHCFIISMAHGGNELSKQLLEIIQTAGKSPSMCLLSPTVSKFNLKIPESSLKRINDGLPERRKFINEKVLIKRESDE